MFLQGKYIIVILLVNCVKDNGMNEEGDLKTTNDRHIESSQKCVIVENYKHKLVEIKAYLIVDCNIYFLNKTIIKMNIVL